jgi:Transposase IS116/IS110/IS902 family
MAAGDVVNTAARLQAAAPVNGILVGDRTFRETRTAIEYRVAEPVAAKGKRGLVAAWEAVGARARLGVGVPRWGSRRRWWAGSGNWACCVRCWRGCLGPVGAARVLSDVADVARFPARGHFASWNGTAPIDASSGEQIRHRLSRAGNRRINRVLHIMAIAGCATTPEAGLTSGARSPPERPRWKPCGASSGGLSDVLYRQLAAEAKTAPAQQAPAGPMETGPGGHVGAATKSSAAGLNPMAGSSDKSLPGPASSNATPSRQISRTPSLT